MTLLSQRVLRPRLRILEDCFGFGVEAGLCDSKKDPNGLVLRSSSCAEVEVVVVDLDAGKEEVV